MQASVRISSSAASKRVIAGVSSTITRSCYRTSRGKAHAAPLSAPEPPPKGQKRVTKEERRARIVEFVDNFRASNDGKFPTIKSVRQQVGGSHYTVREILQEVQYNHSKLPHGDATAGPLQGTVEYAEHCRATDEAKVPQLQGTNEVAEHSGPKDKAKAAQFQGESEFPEHSRPKDDSGNNSYNRGSFKSSEEIQDVDDMLISQKDAATKTGIMEKTETWRYVGSSPSNVETGAAKHDMDTSETWKAAGGTTLSYQTESGSMKVPTNKPSASLRVEAKSDSGNQQRDETNKIDPENTEKSLNVSESDQLGSGKVIEGNTHDREHNPKHEHEESMNTGLFGSLKSFANGIRNFWRKL